MIHLTRLWFDANRKHGLADHLGVTVTRDRPPAVTAETAEIDFAPTLRSFQIRDERGGWREMLADEIARAKDMLDRMAAAAHRELDR